MEQPPSRTLSKGGGKYCEAGIGPKSSVFIGHSKLYGDTRLPGGKKISLTTCLKRGCQEAGA